MSELIQDVSPLTRAIVWLRPQEIAAQDPHYRDIDYLLDGLLTATLKGQPQGATLLVGKNYDRQLLVYASVVVPKKAELESFFTLLEKDLGSEDPILIVDDLGAREDFLKLVPQKILSHFHSL